ncbi:hypothetical protein [Foetidibacter luteolus]|uniref:hypothetical protein n=1 Tax=Foetidibacter luteolus TaxID=2608880 RepID=UPI00129B119B|nr:hypothetical protein [Foetidibacter luteolus]
MKKWAAIFLFAVYVFGATDAYQLLKLPLFVKHFVKHRHEQPGISLTDFIKEHYTGEIVIDDDFKQDMQLPFKTHESECCLTAATLLPQPIEINHTIEEPVIIEYTVLNDDVPLHMVTRSIFQPPKTA